MNNYKASGVVLHTIKYGDNSLIAYVYTDIYGRRSYLVRGVGGSGSRRTKGNKSSLLQPMSVIEFEGYENRHSDLHGMRDVRNKMVLHSLPFDIRKSTIALFMAEVLYRLVCEESTDKRLFDFVCHSIGTLDRLDNVATIANFHLWFLVRLSEFLGFAPGGEYSAGAIFNIEDGVFSRDIPLRGNYMNDDLASILHKMITSSGDDIDAISLTAGRRVEFMEGILNFYGYHFDIVHNINSLKILHEVFR